MHVLASVVLVLHVLALALAFATTSSNCSNCSTVPFRAQQSFVTATQRYQRRQTPGYHKFFLARNVTRQHRQCRGTASHCFGVWDVGQFGQSIDHSVLDGEKQGAFGRCVLLVAVHDVAGTPTNQIVQDLVIERERKH